MHLVFSSTLFGLALLALASCDWDKFNREDPAIGGGGSAGAAGGTGGTSEGGAGGDAPLPKCGALSIVDDDFDDDMVDPMWSVSGSPSEMGSLHLTPGPGGSHAYDTLHYFDFVEQAVSVDVVVPAGAANASQIMRLQADGNNQIWIRQRSGSIHFHKRVETTEVILATLPFDPVAHRYWRLRHANDQVFWETSPDRINWANRAVEPASALFPLDTVRLQLLVTNHDATNAVALEFDALLSEGQGDAWCPMARLADDFDDGVRSRRWQRTGTGAESHGMEYGGQLVIDLAKDIAGAAYEYVSGQPYDLSGAASWVRLIQPADPPATAYLMFEATEGWLRFELADDGMEPAMVKARYRVNGVDTDLQAVSYVAAQHQYWRMRDDGGRLVWELSADGASYEVFASVQPAPFPIDALTVRIGGTTPVANPNPGDLIFDDYNVTP